MLRLVAIAVVLFSVPAQAASLRPSSCDALIAVAQSMRPSTIEVGFGKPIEALTFDEFEQALDMVTVCIDEVQAGPEDVPGLFPRERKNARLHALTILIEDLRFFRNLARERELDRRAAAK